MECVEFVPEAAILLSIDHCVDVVISKALFPLLISHKPGVQACMVFMCWCREGHRSGFIEESAQI